MCSPLCPSPTRFARFIAAVRWGGAGRAELQPASSSPPLVALRSPRHSPTAIRVFARGQSHRRQLTDERRDRHSGRGALGAVADRIGHRPSDRGGAVGTRANRRRRIDPREHRDPGRLCAMGQCPRPQPAGRGHAPFRRAPSPGRRLVGPPPARHRAHDPGRGRGPAAVGFPRDDCGPRLRDLASSWRDWTRR